MASPDKYYIQRLEALEAYIRETSEGNHRHPYDERRISEQSKVRIVRR